MSKVSNFVSSLAWEGPWLCARMSFHVNMHYIMHGWLTLFAACKMYKMNNASQESLGLLFTSSSFVASSDASCLGDDGDEVAIT